MVPLIGLVRVLRATIESGRETVDWMETEAGAEEMRRAYPLNPPASDVEVPSTTE